MSSEIDQDFVEYIVKSLVGNPDKVVIERRIDEKGVLLELTVDPEDLGRIIGKRGATAQSLRTLLRALGTKNDARYNLKIVDNGPEDYQRPERDNTQAQKSAPVDQTKDVQEEQSAEKADVAPVAQPAQARPPRAQRPYEPKTYKEKSEARLIQAIDEPADEVEEDTSSERAKRTRQELQDLDDLDI